jgi:hypothetical protein
MGMVNCHKAPEHDTETSREEGCNFSRCHRIPLEFTLDLIGRIGD